MSEQIVDYVVKSVNVSGDCLPDSKIVVTVVFETNEAIKSGFQAYLELLYRDEIVEIGVPLSNCDETSKSHKCCYTENFIINIPFNAPSGQFDLKFGFKDSKSDERIDGNIIGNTAIGEEIHYPDKICVGISNTIIPDILPKTKQIKVSADIRFSGNIDFDLKPYLSIWKEDLLYGVLESKRVISMSQGHIEFFVELTDDIPEGNYLGKVGLHNIDSSKSEGKTVTVTGTDLKNSEYHKPLSYGNYFVRSSGKEHFWYINQFGALIWDGSPYIPFGGMFVPQYLREYDPRNPQQNRVNFEQDKADLEELKAAGIDDLYIGANILMVTPVWAYKYFFDYLEKSGWKYGIQGDTAERKHGSVYYPRATAATSRLAVNNVKSSGRVTLTATLDFIENYNKAKNAVFVVVEDTTGNLTDCGMASIIETGEKQVVMNADVNIRDGESHTVYFAPEVCQRLGAAVNYWHDPEATYDYIEKKISRLETGDNLRFIVDLLNNESGIYNQIEQGRFSDEEFNSIFAGWLEAKYITVSNLNDAWKSSPKIESFKEAADLIPVYTSERDEKHRSYSFFVSIDTGKGYKIDTCSGVSWNDYLDARDDLYLDFMNRSTDTAKKYLNVPNIYKHVSVQRRYFINKQYSGGFDGLGSEAYGSVDTVTNQYIITTALNNQFVRTAWNVITETNNLENVIGKYNSGQWSYVSKEDMFARYNRAFEVGIKGIYDFLLADRHDLQGKLGMAYSWITNKHVIDWGSEFKKIIVDPVFVEKLIGREYKDKVFYYYPSNKNWWSQNNERSVVQLYDDNYPIKRLKTENGIHVLSTDTLDVETGLIFINLKDAPYTSVFGNALSRFLKGNMRRKRICILGHRNNIGAIPEIDRYFTEEKIPISEDETVQVLRKFESTKVLKTTENGKPWAIRDGDLFILATDQFETSEGDFGILHYVDELGITDFD